MTDEVQKPAMKGIGRFGLGAVAGLMVYACDLYVVRMERILFLLPRYEYLQYLAMVVAGIPFVLAGGLVATLQRSDARPLVVFGSGMLVPALFLAWSNGSALETARREVYQTADPRSATTSLSTPWDICTSSRRPAASSTAGASS